jgi:hypothetical protein
MRNAPIVTDFYRDSGVSRCHISIFCSRLLFLSYYITANIHEPDLQLSNYFHDLLLLFCFFGCRRVFSVKTKCEQVLMATSIASDMFSRNYLSEDSTPDECSKSCSLEILSSTFWKALPEFKKMKGKKVEIGNMNFSTLK